MSKINLAGSGRFCSGAAVELDPRGGRTRALWAWLFLFFSFSFLTGKLGEEKTGLRRGLGCWESPQREVGQEIHTDT